MVGFHSVYQDIEASGHRGSPSSLATSNKTNGLEFSSTYETYREEVKILPCILDTCLYKAMGTLARLVSAQPFSYGAIDLYNLR